MGYERKRGKLADLNALLRGGRKRPLLARRRRRPPCCSSVKYVITLDTDTQLPRDAARQFVGAMAHPLNRAALRHRGKRKAGERVTEGYGILQPRVASSLPGANRSWYARLYGGEPGHRPVHARRLRRLPGRVRRRLVHRQGDLRRRRVRARPRRALSREPDPEPRPARGLLRALGAAERRAAVRGVPVDATAPTSAAGTAGSAATGSSPGGCCRGCPGPARGGVANPLSALSQWKLFDNLRRSLVPVGADAAAAAGLDGAGARLALDAGGDRRSSLLPSASALLLDLAAQAGRGAAAAAPGRRAPARPAGTPRRSALTLAFLPYEATVSLDAIARTAGGCSCHAPTAARVESVGRRRARSPAARRRGRTLRARGVRPVDVDRPGHRRRRGDPAGAVAAPAALAAAAPILLLWFVSPGIAWWISRPLAAPRGAADRGADASSCARSRGGPGRSSRRSSARTTTGCRRTTCRSIRSRAVAHRTSPTNMGLVAAGEPGRLRLRLHPGRRSWSQRTANALATMATLERHEGHFYNWYDTQTLQPLPPLYVSTVDSGNLAGHLLTLRPGLLALADERILDRAVVRGPERHAAHPRRRRGRLPQRRCSCACSGNWSPRSTPGPPRSPPRASGSTGSTRSVAEVAARGRAAASTPRAAPTAADRERPGLLGGRARPPMPEHARRAGVSRAVEPAAACAGSGSAIPTRCARSRRCASSRRSTAQWHRRRPSAARPRATPAQRAWLDELGRCDRGSEPSRGRADRRDRAPGAAMRRAGAHGVRLPLRPGAPPAGDRLQRRRAPAGPELLRPAGLRGAASAASSRSRRASCRRSTGSRSGACSRPRAANRCCCPGAARCSST